MTEAIVYESRTPKNLMEMTWLEVERALTETRTVLIPHGSIEQHGAHLPLGADTYQGDEIAKRVVRSLAAEGYLCVAAPTIPFGVAPYHMGFPGTITLKPTTAIALVEEICESYYRHGFRNFVLIMAHGGNWPILQAVAQTLSDDLPDAHAVALNWLKEQAAHYPRLLKAADPRGESHSGEGETSRMLVSTPHLVQMDEARPVQDERAKKMETHDHPLLGGGVYHGARDFRKATPWGNIGDPRLASAETGEQLYQVIADWICTILKRDAVVTRTPASQAPKVAVAAGGTPVGTR